MSFASTVFSVFSMSSISSTSSICSSRKREEDTEPITLTAYSERTSAAEARL